jgi:hypothetical protein
MENALNNNDDWKKAGRKLDADTAERLGYQVIQRKELSVYSGTNIECWRKNISYLYTKMRMPIITLTIEMEALRCVGAGGNPSACQKR